MTKKIQERQQNPGATALPTKNVNAGKETEARLLPIPLWKPFIGECSHCFLETLMAIFEPPGTLVIFVKMSYLDHPSLSASLTSQLTFPYLLCLLPLNSSPLNSIHPPGGGPNMSLACKAGYPT